MDSSNTESESGCKVIEGDSSNAEVDSKVLETGVHVCGSASTATSKDLDIVVTHSKCKKMK